MERPRISVVVRSFNRPVALAGLLDILLAQRHDAFEVVIVEQSTVTGDDATEARLAALCADARVRRLRFPPLGGPRARNAGWMAARAPLIAFIDDDDLPLGDDWLGRVEAQMADPLRLGMTCRHLVRDGDTPTPTYRRFAARRCMRFSPLLRLPATYARHDTPVRPVDYVHGTGGVVRRELIERVGGWDEDTPIEDETSFAIRAGRAMRPGEHFAFDPTVRLRRDLGVEGGLGKRRLDPAGYHARLMTFIRTILGRYHGRRLTWLYPLYVAASWLWTVEWIWIDAAATRTGPAKLGATLSFTVRLPLLAVRTMAIPRGREHDDVRGGALPR